MNIELLGLEDFPFPGNNTISETINALFNAADLHAYSVNVSFVSNEEMKDLYLQFKGKKKVTDVLSFPIPDMEKLFEHSKYFLGDIVICIPKANAQAREYGHSLLEEIAVLCAHGLFHLLGYDHEVSKEEANIQMQAEMYLLEKIGLRPELSLIGRI